MFFNLYLSEFIRIKYTLITSIIIILMAQILTTFLVRYGLHDHSILVAVIYGVNSLIGFIYVIITPMYYMKQYMKNKEYFISYPLSNIQKYLVILAITFTMIIILFLLEVVENFIFYTRNNAIEHFIAFVSNYFSSSHSLLMMYVGIAIDLCTIFFLINMASFKWFMIVFIIGLTFYVILTPLAMLYFIPIHDTHTLAMVFLLFFGLLTILFIGIGYFRVATLQSSSNRYILQYFIMLVIGLVVSPAISVGIVGLL